MSSADQQPTRDEYLCGAHFAKYGTYYCTTDEIGNDDV